MSRNVPRKAWLAVGACALGLGPAAAGLTTVAQAATPELKDVKLPAKRVEQTMDAVREQIKKRQQAKAEQQQFALAGGVSQATLDAIAACESGGDPTAVNAAGYYGKYQFDTGTWASVGGSGNPAEASEAEQDYRASLLYARAGSSPWPVCGV